MIGIASRAKSPLMQSADIRLLLPYAAEACPANIAPTTSTAMMMALGDALAMAAMRRRGVSRDSFERLHPGGTIGLRLMRVAAVMHDGKDVPLVPATASMREAITTMTELSFGVAGIVNEQGELVGVITDGDLRRNVDVLATSSAADIMTPEPVTIGPDSLPRMRWS
jgi:arabinose-5-phosphate isomerase